MHRNYSPTPPDDVAVRLDEPRAERLEALESIRGLAALTVVFWHLLLAFFPYVFEGRNDTPLLNALLQSPLSVVFDGAFAVRIFFVLSGVVLSLAFFQRPSYEALSSAAIRRYFRLAPPIVFSVLVAYALLMLGWYFNRPAASAFGPRGEWLRTWYDFAPELADALKEGFSCLATFNFRARHTYNAVLWTMPFEMYGSLLVFAVLALVGRLRRRAWIYLALGVAMFTSGSYFLNFIVGIALCDAFVADRRRVRPLELGAIAGTVLILLGLGIATLRAGSFHGAFASFVKANQHDFKTAGAAIVIGVVLFCPFWRRALERPSLTALGRYSFSLYLLHLPITCSLGCYSFILAHALGCSVVGAGLMAAGLVVATTLVAARFCYTWIDRPSIALAKWIEKHFRPANSGPTAETSVVATQ